MIVHSASTRFRLRPAVALVAAWVAASTVAPLQESNTSEAASKQDTAPLILFARRVLSRSAPSQVLVATQPSPAYVDRSRRSHTASTSRDHFQAPLLRAPSLTDVRLWAA